MDGDTGKRNTKYPQKNQQILYTICLKLVESCYMINIIISKYGKKHIKLQAGFIGNQNNSSKTRLCEIFMERKQNNLYHFRRHHTNAGG